MNINEEKESNKVDVDGLIQYIQMDEDYLVANSKKQLHDLAYGYVAMNQGDNVDEGLVDQITNMLWSSKNEEEEEIC